MTDLLRAWLAWWCLSAALWLCLVDRVHTGELLTGAGVAAAAATVAAAVRAQRRVVLRPRARWLAGLPRPLLGLVADVVPLSRALVARGILRRDGAGTLTEIPFGAVGDGGEEAAYRVLTETLGSLAPNTIVVDVDRERGVLICHELVATDAPAKNALPLGGDAR